jgi:hypothetical protein
VWPQTPLGRQYISGVSGVRGTTIVTHSHLQQSAQQQSTAAWCACGLWNEQGNQECPTGCARAKQQQLRDQAGSGCERNVLICNDTGREEE